MPMNTVYASKYPRRFRAPREVIALIFLMSSQGWGLTLPAADEAPPTSFRVEIYGHGQPMRLQVTRGRARWPTIRTNIPAMY
jgi:hypothetical protein